MPPAEELLRRLRAVYCRHKQISYKTYDEMVAREEITYAEVHELIELLFGEIQHVGLYDFLFQEEAQARKAAKARLVEIEKAMERIGSMSRYDPAMRDRYAPQIDRLKAEARELKEQLGE